MTCVLPSETQPTLLTEIERFYLAQTSFGTVGQENESSKKPKNPLVPKAKLLQSPLAVALATQGMLL